MSNILFWIMVVVAAAILVFVLYTYFQKPAFSLVREADFKAAPGAIFLQINSFKNWSAWSPWEQMDPSLQRSFSGTTSGVGAKYAWIGNKKVGQGNMEITHSTPAKSMQLNLNFIKPFEAHNITEFTLTPLNGGGTRMKWEMRGQRNFGMRFFGTLFNMDKLVGRDFEKGMTNLKAIVD